MKDILDVLSHDLKDLYKDINLKYDDYNNNLITNDNQMSWNMHVQYLWGKIEALEEVCFKLKDIKLC